MQIHMKSSPDAHNFLIPRLDPVRLPAGGEDKASYRRLNKCLSDSLRRTITSNMKALKRDLGGDEVLCAEPDQLRDRDVDRRAPSVLGTG